MSRPSKYASRRDRTLRLMKLACLLVFGIAAGCGTSKSRIATEQLLVSNAVDVAVADLDFRPLAGRTVHFDTDYIKNVKGTGFVNADYIISALRQQMIAADCRLMPKREDADYVVEARVGTIGMDSNEVVYGIPASNALSTALSLVPSAPIIPTIPEISLARKDAQSGAAKIAVFAYNRSTGRPAWQSGISRAKSTARNYWVLGAGPFQRGSIYDGTQFAGERIRLPDAMLSEGLLLAPPVAYFTQHIFRDRNVPTRVATRPAPRSLDTTSNAGQASPVATAPVSTGEWLTPLQPKIVTPLESKLDWR